MLGMMNAPSDSIEFYATNQKLKSGVAHGSDLSKFSETKSKDVISYTEDGRKMVNGKLVVASDAPSMWGDALLRGRIRTISPSGEQKTKKEKAKGKRASKKLDKTIAVVASLQKMGNECDDVISSKDTPSSSTNPPIQITNIPIVGSSVPLNSK